jgi:hypothetical protein
MAVARGDNQDEDEVEAVSAPEMSVLFVMPSPIQCAAILDGARLCSRPKCILSIESDAAVREALRMLGS